MKIFVAGGTGVLGRPAVQLLVAQGHDVMVLARTPEREAAVTAAGATPVSADLFDRDSLVRAAAGAEVVVNLATAIPSLRKAAASAAWAQNDRIRSTGATNLVSAAMAVGARRYIQESIVLLYADGGDAWVDEDSPTHAHPRVASLFVAEAQVERAAQHGLAAVALRFGLFHGPEGSQAREMVSLLRLGLCPSIGGADDFVPVIAVDDAAAAVVAALDVPSGTYNIVDDEPLRRRDYCRVLCAGVDRSRAARLPAAAGRMKQVRHVAQSLRVSNARFKQVSDWRPRYQSIRDSWPDAMARMNAAGQAREQLV